MKPGEDSFKALDETMAYLQISWELSASVANTEHSTTKLNSKFEEGNTATGNTDSCCWINEKILNAGQRTVSLGNAEAATSAGAQQFKKQSLSFSDFKILR